MNPKTSSSPKPTSIFEITSKRFAEIYIEAAAHLYKQEIVEIDIEKTQTFFPGNGRVFFTIYEMHGNLIHEFGFLFDPEMMSVNSRRNPWHEDYEPCDEVALMFPLYKFIDLLKKEIS